MGDARLEELAIVIPTRNRSDLVGFYRKVSVDPFRAVPCLTDLVEIYKPAHFQAPPSKLFRIFLYLDSTFSALGRSRPAFPRQIDYYPFAVVKWQFHLDLIYAQGE